MKTVRTTVRLPQEVMRAAKRRALETGRSFTDLLTDALRASLAAPATPDVRERIALPTYGSRGVRPGVDLDDSAALLELMDGE